MDKVWITDDNDVQEIMDKVDVELTVLKGVCTWFPELKIESVDNTYELIEKLRLYLNQFTNLQAIDRINRKLLELKDTYIFLKSYYARLEDVSYNHPKIRNKSSEFQRKLDFEKKFIISTLEEEKQTLRSNLHISPKVEWLGNVGQIGEVLHKFLEYGYLNVGKSELVRWADSVFIYDGRASSIEDVLKKGKSKYPKMQVIELISKNERKR